LLMEIEKLTDKEQLIIDFIKDNKVDVDEVIDAIIKYNGIIGVGLVSLQEHLVYVVKKHFKQESLDKIMNG
jgi:ribose 5-phosphate isomerase